MDKDKIYKDLMREFTDKFKARLIVEGIPSKLKDMGFSKGSMNLNFIYYPPEYAKRVNRIYGELYAKFLKQRFDDYKDEIHEKTR